MTLHDRFQQRWAELRRQPTFQAALVFLGGGWLALQAADVLGLPTGAVRALGALVLAVFAGLTFFAWLAATRAIAAGRAAPVATSRARGRTLLVLAVVLIVLAAGFWWLRPRLFASEVAEGAERIAVLPFSTSGASVDVLSEGLVDLLSANLDEAAGIRTINPRTALYHWRQAAGRGGLDLEGQLRVGRELGAGSILTGSAVAVGDDVRITASLLAVGDGERIAHAEVNGSSDDVLALVDAVSIALLRDIWRARSELPALSVAGITTHSLPAMRDFLRGERFFRRSAFDSASAAYQLAIQHDSTFALAYFRLAETFGWRESLGSQAAQDAAARAVRFAERLPTRERRLLIAHQLHEAGDAAAIDSLRLYTRTFPDDATGWYFLGDALYHGVGVRPISPADIYAPFDSALARDSALAHTYAHPLELSILSNDSVRVARYLSGYTAVVPEDSFYLTLSRVRMDPGLVRPDALLPLLRATQTRASARFLLIGAAAANLLRRPQPDVAGMLVLTDSLEQAMDGVQLDLQMMRLGLGRFAHVDSVAQRMLAQGAPEAAMNMWVTGLLQGITPPGWWERVDTMMERAPDGAPHARYWHAALSLQQGDTAPAHRYLAAARDTAAIRAALGTGIAGLLSAARGDTARAVGQLRAALDGIGYAPANNALAMPLRLQLLMLELATPEFQEEGLERLAFLETRELVMVAGLYLPIAEALERGGEEELAVAMYARFVTLWEGADPGVQHYVDAARASLQRLRSR